MKSSAKFTVRRAVQLVAASMSAVILPASVVAQETPELITVIAKKRSQDASQVDISMDVFVEEQIRSLQLNTLPELSDYSENVALFEDIPGASLPTWVIRGVGLQDFNVNNPPAASVYVDGAYQVSTAMGSSALFDVEQVEILKGPQSGLYGRNTSGGAVLFNTRRASLDGQAGNIELGYGRWGRSQVNGALNLPLNDKVAWRLAGQVRSSNDGWQQSLAGGGAHGEQDRWDLRSWLHYEGSESFQADLKLQAGTDDSDIGLGRAIGFWELGASGPALCQAVLGGQRDEVGCQTWAGLTQTILNGQSQEQLSRQAADGSLVYSDPINRLSNDYGGMVLELVWRFDDIQLISVSTIDYFNYGIDLDVDGSTGEFAHRLSSSDMEVFSQEFRLLGDSGSSLQWVAGLNYSNEAYEELRDFIIRDNILVQNFTGLGEAGRLQYKQDTDSWALYADFNYQLNNQWFITGGLRYTDEDKEYRNGRFYLPVNPPFYYSQGLDADYSLDSNWSGSVALNWSPSADQLWYLKYSEGFKSGGFYGGIPFSLAEVLPYAEETISAWELGLKYSLYGQQLQVTAALFSYDYQDVQGFIRKSNPLTGTDIDVLGNQGDASHLGAEAGLHWTPDDNWRLDGGIGWLDAEFDRSGIFTVGIDQQLVEIQGKRPYAPSLNANMNLGYSRGIASGLTLDMVLGWNYRSEFSGHAYSAVDQAINHLPGYALINLTAGLEGQDGGWEVMFWVKNLADKTYRTRVKADGLNSYFDVFGEPRSYGLTVRLDF